MTETALYIISPPDIPDLDQFADHLSAALDGGPVASFQLRLKLASDADIIATARRLMPICHDRDVAFILNDRADLAQALRTDGVHLGQQDMDYAAARQMVGDDAVIGISCGNSRHLSMIAAEQGADYVAFGAFFPTGTKTDTKPADPEILTWWAELFEPPCVAIGGITVDNVAPIIQTGTDFIAVSGGIWHYPQGPKAAVTAFTTLMKAVS